MTEPRFLSLLLVALCIALLGGCVIVPPPMSAPANDPANPQAHVSSGPRLRPGLIAGTKRYLSTSEGANAQEMGDMGGMSMGGMGGMQGGDLKAGQKQDMPGMDSSQMAGMEKKAPANSPPPSGAMQGMDHSKMPGMQPPQPAEKSAPPPDAMQGMDHSKMPGMTSPAPNKEVLEQEMKKTSDEMKKTSKAMKQKSDDMKPGAAIYTCVMHPEVQSDKPGNCPKCGMKLVEKKGNR